MEHKKNILCIKATGMTKDGSLENENLRSHSYSATVDTDDGKCIRLWLAETGNVHNVMTKDPPEPPLRLQECFIDTGSPDDGRKNRLLRYSASRGGLCLEYGGKIMGSLCPNDKESIRKYVNDTFGCSYDGAEILPHWAKIRESAAEMPAEYDHGYYMRMQECIGNIEALYEKKAEKVREENMKAHPGRLWWQRRLDPLSIREKKRGVLEVEMSNASSDYPPLCGRTREDLQMELMGTNVPAALKFTVDTADPDFMKRLPFSDEMRIKAMKERAVSATPGFHEASVKSVRKNQDIHTGMER